MRRILSAAKNNRQIYRLGRQIIAAYRRHRYGLTNTAKTFYVANGCNISRDLTAGEHSFINVGCFVCAGVSLGRYVMLGPRVSIVGRDHLYTEAGVPTIFSGRPEVLKTMIGDDVWIGHGATIMEGVTIGRSSIVAAGSIVTRDLEPFGVYAGVPARLVRPRFADEVDQRKHEAMLNSSEVYEGDFAASR